jgi:hypothetical protein
MGSRLLAAALRLRRQFASAYGRDARYTVMWFRFRVEEARYAPASQARVVFTYLKYNAKSMNSMLEP